MSSVDLAQTKEAQLARELAARLMIPVGAPQIHVMTCLAHTRDRNVLNVVERVLALAGRPSAIAGLIAAMESVSSVEGPDPLAELDEPLSAEEAAGVVALAEVQASETRARLLSETVGAEEAAKLTHRSRQSLERFRREGRVLALREGKRWCYPRWQFEPDAPGGVVRGLGEVLVELRLSPAGAAYWLTRRHERLNASPIDLLRRGWLEPVVEAAREMGERP